MREFDKRDITKGMVMHGDAYPGVEVRDLIKPGTFMTSGPMIKSAPVDINLAEIRQRLDAFEQKLNAVRQAVRRERV